LGDNVLEHKTTPELYMIQIGREEETLGIRELPTHTCEHWD
jgi:hypothetical protein